MSRLIFVVLIICLVVYFFKQRSGKTSNKNSSPANTASSDNVESSKEAEDMVQCTTCQVHLPRSEAFLVADNFYCCQAHIQKK
jgi:uncharacterized membrane protein AbrB (regulator of aidB expression)